MTSPTVPLDLDADSIDASRTTVTGLDFLGEVTFPTGLTFDTTTVGGLSGITYDAANNLYYTISDDRSQINPARYYTLSINLQDGALNAGDITFNQVTTLLDGSGNPFPAFSLDPEAIVLTDEGNLFVSSEGDVTRSINPFVNAFALTGEQLAELPISTKFLVTPTGSSGIRNNLAFESLTVTPDNRYLFTATENALFQDGPAADLTNESPSRIVRYNLVTGLPDQEFLYLTDPVVDATVPAGTFSTNGLVELLALDNGTTLLALERSFSTGVGNNIRLYEVNIANTTNIKDFNAVGGLDVDAVAEKRLLLDFNQLGLTLDNVEGMTFGPKLPDGRQSLIFVSDNNFAATQFTQFLAFAVDLKTTPAVAPTLETPPLNRITDAGSPDSDDPAIYVHPTDSSKSLVITSLKDGGLVVYDLNGQEVQRILPTNRVRYNNVDVVYGFKLGQQKVDLAIASDRRNDTLAIFQINPTTRQLSDITASVLSAPAASIFGLDNGSQTAYGLTSYTSPVTGKSYVFVSQRAGDTIAQLELVNAGNGKVTAEVVRTLKVPIPAGSQLEDAQVEGMVADRELGYLYVGQEGGGIFKFFAEPDAPTTSTLIVPEGDVITADVEGLTIYYGANGTGYLLASSQGDSTYAAFTRDGSNDYLGSFAINDGIDGVEESDGADVINVPLGSQFPSGLLVVHDGSNEPAQVLLDDGEIQNFSTNFKFVAWENVANAFPDPLNIDTTSYNPRNPTPNSLINNVASGDTTQNSTVLWARSIFKGKVTFEYSTRSNFRRILGSKTVTVTDPNQPVKTLITGLDDNTQYYYRVTDAAGAIATGTFTTAAEKGTRVGLRFGAAGDWRGELSPYPAISNADDRRLDFFISLGDTIYADFPSPGLRNPDGSFKAQATTLDDYRLKHSEVYSSRFGVNTWGDLRSSTSILAIIDDHEVVNDFEGGRDLATASTADQALFGATSGLVNDSPLYNNGLQVFQDYNPIRDEVYGATGDTRTEGERKLYRYRTYGSDAAAFVLDARSFRDEELPGVTNPADPAQVTNFLVQSFNPTRTLLGRPQVADLKADLLKAEKAGITWKFITVPEPIQNLGVVAAGDRFEGYAAERTEILDFINQNNIDNVVFISADIHSTLVNNLTYQRGPGQPQIATSAFEITTGAVAFDAPFGPTVAGLAANLGLLSPAQKAFYDSLPIANDADSIPNDKDDFVKQLTNAQLAPLGYDPLGLNDNLAIANGAIDAKLLQGDYVALHTYGWSEFDIDPDTQKLTVTTYGIPAYTEAELLANPSLISQLTPTIVSQFEVNPTQLGQGGNYTFEVAAGSGTTTIKEFGGADPKTGISRKEIDVLQFKGEDLTARNLLLTQKGQDLELSFRGVANTAVVLKDFALAQLDNWDGDVGNIRFNKQTKIQDSFDVVDATAQPNRVFNRNTVTFLNDLNNITRGFDASRDVINGQGGNDKLLGLSGNDLLRGGDGDDLLDGGKGRDLLCGGSGKDTFILRARDGVDAIADFNLSQNDKIGLAGGLSFSALTISQGTGANANNTLIEITRSGESLAVLRGIQASTVTGAAFTQVI